MTDDEREIFTCHQSDPLASSNEQWWRQRLRTAGRLSEELENANRPSLDPFDIHPLVKLYEQTVDDC